MTPEQKVKIHELVYRINETAIDCGYYSKEAVQKTYQPKNDKAWEDFKAFLDSIPMPEDGLLEGESIRCNIDPLPLKNNFKGFGP